jgi:phosphatidylinositol glycan class F
MSSALSKGSSSRSAAPSKNDMTAASQSTATSTPLLHPIQIKPNPLAQSARHAFPALLAGLFVVRFRALVADPVSAMATTLMLSAVLQVAYAVICLPPAGSSQGGAARAARKPRPGEKKRVGFESAAGPNAIAVSHCLVLILFCFISFLSIPN